MRRIYKDKLNNKIVISDGKDTINVAKYWAYKGTYKKFQFLRVPKEKESAITTGYERIR